MRACRRTFSFSLPAQPIHSAAADAGSRSHQPAAVLLTQFRLCRRPRAVQRGAAHALSQRCQHARLSRAAALGVRFSRSHRFMATVESTAHDAPAPPRVRRRAATCRPARAVATGAAAERRQLHARVSGPAGRRPASQTADINRNAARRVRGEGAAQGMVARSAGHRNAAPRGVGRQQGFASRTCCRCCRPACRSRRSTW